MRTLVQLISILSLSAILTQCTKSFEGTYEDPDKAEIIDDRWNETDARKTAETMVRGMLNRPWLKNFQRAKQGKRPIVVVDEIENRTDEHIDTEMLTEFVRDEMINSGRVRFLNKKAREKIMAEVKYQRESGNVSSSSAQKSGRQVGAQYFLGGAMTSIVQQREGLKSVTYQTNLILTNLETSEIEWSDKMRIRKKFKKSKGKW